jgi:exosortase H (IPTLxxWG-CTERM-specific)
MPGPNAPDPNPTDSGASSARLRFGFVLRFVLILAALYLPLLYEPIDTGLVEPFTRGVAALSAGILNLLGQHVVRSGTLLSAGSTAVSVRNGCNGIEAMVFLIAATLAFSAPWRQRVGAALAGSLLIQILNLIRVVSLFLLQRYQPQLFELFHLAIWQTIIGGASVAFFYKWTRRTMVVADAAHSR